MPCLKCCFYYYSGVMRLTDQEMTVIEKIVCRRSQEEGECHVTLPQGEAPGSVKRLRE